MPKTRLAKRSPLFRAILCATDFSEPSALALRYAAVLAQRSAGRLHVLHVSDPLLVAAAATALGDRTLPQAALRELPPFVAKSLPSGTRKSLAIKYLVETGAPDATIAAVARRLRCDLIVVGTHGLSGASKLLIGSTTERLFRRTRVPLLAIPPPRARIGAAKPGVAWPGPSVMASVDFRGGSQSEVRAAAGIARAFGADLLLAHAVPQTTPPPWYRADLAAHWYRRVLRAQRRLQSLADDVGAGVQVDTRVVSGDPADELAALAAEKHVGLVVIHVRKGAGIFGLRIGSVAYRVLGHAVTPVLALPGGTRSPWRRRR